MRTFSFSWPDKADETEYRLLSEPARGLGFTLVTVLAANTVSHSIEVFLPDSINARYILQACNAGGCVDSDTVSVSGNLASSVGYFKASNPDADDIFGRNVALSLDGLTMAVSAIGEDGGVSQMDNSSLTSGAVYVFVKSGGIWSQEAYLKTLNAQNGDKFGVSLSLSDNGDVLAAGATGEDSASAGINNSSQNNSMTDSGAVYVFERGQGSWTQAAYIKTPNPLIYREFGASVSLSGDGKLLAAGYAAEASDSTGIDGDPFNMNKDGSGAVFVYARDASTWNQQAYIKAGVVDEQDNFGASVDLSNDGRTLAVSALGEDGGAGGINGDPQDNTRADTGAIYIFSLDDQGVWSQEAIIKPTNVNDYAYFGLSISLSADGSALASSFQNDSSAATGVNGDRFDQSMPSAGAAYVFRRAMGQWSEEAYLKASNPAASAIFGQSLAMSATGDVLVVGSPNESSDSRGVNADQTASSLNAVGAVYVFKHSPAGWAQSAFLKSPNSRAQQNFGYSVAISGNADAIFVGATGERGSDTGIDGDQSDAGLSSAGAVYLY